MSRRRLLVERMRRLAEIRRILGSMKILAYMETQRLAPRLDNQQRMVATIERAAADIIAFHPCPQEVAGLPHAILLIGSQRGLCGDLDQRLLARLDALAAAEPQPPALLGVGLRLGARLDGDPRLALALDGADTADEIERVLAAVVDAVAGLRQRLGPLRLTALHADADGEEILSAALLPPFPEPAAMGAARPLPPLIQLEPPVLLAGLIDHYLLAQILESLCTALMAENRLRLRHLEGALSHLDERLETLQRRGRRLRQEEIIEEIEVLLLAAAEPLRGTGVQASNSTLDSNQGCGDARGCAQPTVARISKEVPT